MLKYFDMVYIIFMIFVIVMLIVLVPVIFKGGSSAEITKLSMQNCPRSVDMNFRFECLYNKFGKGLSVPHIFKEGDMVRWKDIYENIDYLLENT